MSEDQQPPIERHLTEEELDGAIDEAEQANEPRLVRRLCFINADDEDEEDDVVTDGGTVVGFLDEAWPQPTDNSQRVWAFGTPRLAKQMPSFDDAVLGFYAILGTSVVACKPDASQTSFAEFFERILLVCDNFSSHFAAETNDAAAEYVITRVRLPPYSPHLNPIEQLWKSLKRDLSPLSAESGEEFRVLIRESFQKFSERLSFATGWIGRFLDIQRL